MTRRFSVVGLGKLGASLAAVIASKGHHVVGVDVNRRSVDAPNDERGAFSLQYVAYAFREIGKALATTREWHTVVLTSTVLPGAMRLGLVPILEQHSGGTAGADFGVCYSPTFIALGSVIHDLLNPDL